jgi:hypothetical protein
MRYPDATMTAWLGNDSSQADAARMVMFGKVLLALISLNLITEGRGLEV